MHEDNWRQYCTNPVLEQMVAYYQKLQHYMQTENQDNNKAHDSEPRTENGELLWRDHELQDLDEIKIIQLI